MAFASPNRTAPKAKKKWVLLVKYPFPFENKNRNEVDGYTIYDRYESHLQTKQAQNRFIRRWADISRNQNIQTDVREIE